MQVDQTKKKPNQNKTKQKKQNKTKQNKTKQNKTKQNKTKQKKTKQNKNKTKKKTRTVCTGSLYWGGTFNLTRTLSFFTLFFQPRSWHKTTSEPKKSLRTMIFPGIPLTSLCIYEIWRCWYMQARVWCRLSHSWHNLCRVIKVIGWPAYPVQVFQSLLSLKSKILSYHINVILVFEYKGFFYSKVIF